jgi:endonuclease/exonuclease/phosphatase family metal-dependent hydrolase
MRFRLITYNVHKGIGGVDRLYRPERIIETLRHYHPDIVLLQEVADGMPRSRGDRQVDVFGTALGLDHRAYQRNVKLTRGHYGNAILSRFPLVDTHHIDLTVPLKKRRQALVASCDTPGHGGDPLLLFNCHLGLAGYERAIQLQQILASPALARAGNGAPVIVAGDYNDLWGTLGRRCMEPAGFRSACYKARTFPAIMPVRPLDCVYFRGALALRHGFPCHRQIAKEASDHLPLVVDFELE